MGQSPEKTFIADINGQLVVPAGDTTSPSAASASAAAMGGETVEAVSATAMTPKAPPSPVLRPSGKVSPRLPSASQLNVAEMEEAQGGNNAAAVAGVLYTRPKSPGASVPTRPPSP